MPRMTFTAGNDALASEVNTYLMDQAVQTYASATARNSALPTPTEGQLTYLDDLNQYQTYTGSTWYPVAGQMPYIELTKTASQNFTSGTAGIVVTWATPTINRGGFTVATNVITVPHTGLYDIDTAIYWAGNSNGARLTKIFVNSTEVTRSLYATGSTLAYTAASTYPSYLTAGDTITVEAYQNSGATLAAQANLTRLTIRYVSP